ncbi:MAG: translation initiation factor IF-3 [Gammaproteobacteria bacterium]|nr:translation initiation factor IF-3 [Gammaproteobacteria bacterium]MCY4209703.1 translation initiation factor IF-3 [Gammaproteobacteria bacterium]MCY4282298.1 translation initiation factor IF-3 [Gammaproteobacteria bacterium]MCY4339181.1 translation initiation factor IF-3 [Gammaproteobacteria bacterium]
METAEEQRIAIKKQNRVNEEITAAQVRLIGPQGGQVGIVDLDEAMRQADTADLDLVEIVPNADPPVCRIMDFGKFLFEQNKKRHAARKKQKQIQVKEVKFRPGTDAGDYQVKLRNIARFVENGDKVKVTLRFRGREMAHQELGSKMLGRIEADMRQSADVEQRAKLEGRQMVMILAPKR